MKKALLFILSALLIALCACSFVACSSAYNPWEAAPHEHYYLKRTVAPNCTEHGYDYRYCADCMSNYKENFVPALSEGGHDYDGYVCTRCNALDPEAPITDYNDLSFAPVYADNSNGIVGYEVKGLAAMSLKYLKIPSTYMDKPVIGIGIRAFYECKELVRVELPDTITTIGQSAFNNCIRLVSINLPEGIETIEKSTFKYCFKLNEINFPNSLRVIETESFWDCHNLEYVELNAGLKNIEEVAFLGCGLKNIAIPDSVQYIGQQAFEGCDRLEEVDIGGGITELSLGMFSECKTLKKIKLPISLEYIDVIVFEKCTALEAIEYEGTVEQWVNKVYRAADGDDIAWNSGVGAYKVICSDGTVQYNGQYKS